MNKRQHKKWWKYCTLEAEPIDIWSESPDWKRRWYRKRYSPKTIRLFERRKRALWGGRGRKIKGKFPRNPKLTYNFYKPSKHDNLVLDDLLFDCEQTDEELPFVEVKYERSKDL